MVTDSNSSALCLKISAVKAMKQRESFCLYLVSPLGDFHNLVPLGVVSQLPLREDQLPIDLHFKGVWKHNYIAFPKILCATEKFPPKHCLPHLHPPRQLQPLPLEPQPGLPLWALLSSHSLAWWWWWLDMMKMVSLLMMVDYIWKRQKGFQSNFQKDHGHF